MVGSSARFAYGQPHHAFLWENGVMTDLGTLGGRASYALALNERGHIVGYSSTGTGQYRATLWLPNN